MHTLCLCFNVLLKGTMELTICHNYTNPGEFIALLGLGKLQAWKTQKRKHNKLVTNFICIKFEA